MAESKPGIEVRIGPGPVVPGSPVTVEVVPQRFIDPGAVRAELSTVIANRFGVERRVSQETTVVEATDRLVPGQTIRLDVPIPGLLPPGFRCTGGSLRWRISVSCGSRPAVEQDLDIRPHPSAVSAESLVDRSKVAERLDRNRRTGSSIGSRLDLVMGVLAFAIAALPVFLLVERGNAFVIWVIAGFLLSIVLDVVVRRVFARADSHPFELDDTVVRRGRSATIRFATPLESDLAGALLTRVETRRGADEGVRIAISWELGPVTRMPPGTLTADVLVSPDAPTFDDSALRVDHWIRVQPSAATQRAQGWIWRRSDRPVFVVA